ncbi:MAG: Gfo/Idh/MocA family oxidoreductase [Chitinophagaceae bacterium]|nr:Gfo/Idh/MocA family oxidoreductase [Chitinophagaceae bacterium]MBK9938105.1 Gfo/Idh/MocA family oxidoreductase [Chitinophagaceae bacterium]MBP6232162.1 Gfo/Idh/MocA family oxidoreductase [Chitinophagaceae bacterium]
MLNRKLRMGMIGGGPGSFIGAIHRIAANMDGEIELVCGAFSSDAEKSKQTGASLYLPPERVYGSYKEMIRRETELPANERMDFVSIVTPNHFHFEPAKLALENGFHVVLDKPMTFNLSEAKELQSIVAKSGKYFCLTHTYTGYPLLKEARQQVLSGKFGDIRKIYVEYPQGWLSTLLESSDNKQADWRTDPTKSGASGAIGDIGTHAFNMSEYVTGLKVTKLCADLNIVVEGRKLDDDGSVLLKFNNGASGILFVTQVAPGEDNNIRLRVFGDKGGLDWSHSDANTLYIKWPDKPTEIWRAGESYLGAYAKHNSRTPAGHPEGYLEAFANHYRNFALSVKAQMTGEKPKEEWLDFPGIEDGVRGMAFIETVVKSSLSDKKFIDFEI